MGNIFGIGTGTGFVDGGLLFRLKSRGTMLQFFSHIRVFLVVYWNWANVREFDLVYARTDMDCSHSDGSLVRVWIEVSRQFQENSFGTGLVRLTTIKFICD
jgi:hypothetical protein